MKKHSVQRSGSRKSIHQPVSFELSELEPGRPRNIVKNGLGMDISPGGMGLTTDYPLKEGAVGYATGGMCYGDAGHQILQPINSDGSSVFKKGSTVPAKFRVCDANGVSIGTPGVVLSFKLVQTINGTVTDTVVEDVYSTTPDAAFRWSASDQQWIFNISTKTLTASYTYGYQITLNDGSVINFTCGLK